MLDHDEERRLAEIEAHLALDDPDLQRLLEDGVPRPPSRAQAAFRSLVALLAAVVITTLVTWVAGPNLGGLVAVIALSVAGMYAYQILRGCPGLRRSRGEHR